jgi:hypothetical protein
MKKEIVAKAMVFEADGSGVANADSFLTGYIHTLSTCTVAAHESTYSTLIAYSIIDEQGVRLGCRCHREKTRA